MRRGLQTYLPPETFTAKFPGQGLEAEFAKAVWREIYKVGIVVDYNDYTGDGLEFVNEGNVVVVSVDWTAIKDVRTRLRRATEFKKMFNLEELSMLFGGLFSHRKDFELFVKNSFNRVVLQAHKKSLSAFLKFNPLVNEDTAVEGANFEYIMYKTRTVIA